MDVPEPQIEMIIEGDSQTLEKEDEEVGGEPLDESLPFCRLCYITFSTHADQLPHEQKVIIFNQTPFNI